MSLYSTIYQQCLMPFHGLVKNRRYSRRLSLLESSQWWSRDQLLEFQWQEVRRLLEWAFRSVPYYQAKYGKAGIALGDIRTREDFAKLPVLTRGEVNANRQRLCSTEFRGKLLPHATGGSSGTPTRFYRTIESYDWRIACKDRTYSWSGWAPGEKAAHLWGAPVGEITWIPAFKTRMFDFVQRQMMIRTFSQTPQLWRDTYTRLKHFRPTIIVGYASSLEEFARFLDCNDLRLRAPRAVIAAAEPLYETSRRFIAEVIGAPVFNTYGCREFMSLAGECDIHDGLHINAENVLVETESPHVDEPSEVLVTDLHNYGMPFIRYAIGDIGVLDNSQCPCGRGLPKLKRVDGRVLDALRTVDGRNVHGMVFPHLFKDIPEITQFRVEQDAPDHLKILTVLREALSNESRALLHTELLKVLGPTMRWDVCPVTEIPCLPSGKRRITVGLSEAQSVDVHRSQKAEC